MTDVTETEIRRYHLLKAADSLFGRRPDALDGDDLTRARATADTSYRLESRILASSESHRVGVPPDAVRDAIAELGTRFNDQTEFLADLSASGLDLASLREGLHREIWAEATLDAVAAKAVTLDPKDVDAFYHQHRAAFSMPEMRTISHILVTINEEDPMNRRDAALERITQAKTDIEGGRDFGEVAMMMSECPSAVEQGVLGRAPRGKLFPEVEACLFDLATGAIGGPVESEMGFHLVRCDAIHAPEDISLEDARPRIEAQLYERAKTRAQKKWLAELFQVEREPVE